MKFYREITFIVAMAISSLIWFTIPSFNGYPLNIIPYALLILFLPGYSLLGALKPSVYEKPVPTRIIYGVNLSLLVTFIMVLSSQFSTLNIPLYILLFTSTIIFTILAFVRMLLSDTETSDTPEEPVLIDPDEELPDDVAIRVQNVSMEFNLSQEKVDNLKEYVIKLLKRELFYQEFWALKNVSFELKKGDKLGVVGLNGAGKSTLLKLISGVMKPTKGHIKVKGSLVPLLELGAGFDYNYTGRENIFLNGAMLGYPKSFMESKYDEIVEFSEIEDFIDVPLKNYSSGMKARLGFSIATIVEPEILILDEVLSVGDVKFRKKSLERMKSFLNQDTTVLLVSHSIKQVKDLCDRAIWLEKGKMVMEGPADEVCDKYLESIK